ncbi:MAG TPA: secretin N-terminal domain-containing protein [Opitutaceae bacterium]|nr:secretin N-terminal domain-containing protein [Opitutaceae bacterium]
MASALVVRVAAQPAPAAQPAAPAAQPAAPAQAPAVAPAPAPAPAEPEVTIKGPDSQGASATKGHDASGKDTLSVDFPDEDIRTIIRNVADLFELNIIIPETLQGKTTIKLRDVTWRQIFTNVLSPVGYTYVEDGNIIKIISNESQQQEPATTKVFILNYAKATDVMPTISGLVDTAAGGKIVVSSATNSLVITERPSRMGRIQDIVDQLDRATDQVMIETKFVEVTDGDVRNLGVNWSTLKAYKLAVQPEAAVNTTGGQNTSNGTSGSAGNSGSNTQTATSGQTLGSSSSTANGVPTTSTNASLTNSLTDTVTNTATSALNLLNSITNSTSISRTSSAVFSADQFGFVLSALTELSRTKVVSNPTIVTLNNSEATINVGEQDPVPNYSYNEQRGTFEVSGFNYKDIGINLKVTPQVNARGFIKLNVQPEVSQKNGSVNFGGAGGAEIPIIATRKATTTISLKDGYTMGIGGLITSTNQNSSNKVPLIGDIPLVGNLFKQKSNNLSTTNLLIFITASVIAADGAPANKVFDPRQVRAAGLEKDDLPGFRDGSDPFLPAAPANAKKKK